MTDPVSEEMDENAWHRDHAAGDAPVGRSDGSLPSDAQETERPARPEISPHVLVPDEFGELAVCDLGMLMDNLLEGGSLDEAVLDASMDSIQRGDIGPTAREHIARIRQLNLTGDAGAYWGFDKEDSDAG